MDRVLARLAFAFVYLDDIIIASPSMEQHQQDVEEVFRRLQAASLVNNFEKCTFAVPEVDFQGHRLSASGFAPLPSRVAAIQKYPRPATVNQLLAFLGVFNFCRRFVPAATKILRPLTDSTRGSPKATAAVEWTPPIEAAFEATRGGGRVAGAPTARPGVGSDSGCFRRPCRRGSAAAALAGGGLAGRQR
jgi:hypothetical protein